MGFDKNICAIASPENDNDMNQAVCDLATSGRRHLRRRFVNLRTAVSTISNREEFLDQISTLTAEKRLLHESNAAKY